MTALLPPASWWLKRAIVIRFTLRFHQTWLAGKWTIEISGFPNQTSIQFGDFPASHVWLLEGKSHEKSHSTTIVRRFSLWFSDYSYGFLVEWPIFDSVNSHSQGKSRHERRELPELCDRRSFVQAPWSLDGIPQARFWWFIKSLWYIYAGTYMNDCINMDFQYLCDISFLEFTMVYQFIWYLHLNRILKTWE